MKKKLILVAIFLAIVGCFTLFDAIKMTTEKIVLDSINPTPAVADSQKPVSVAVTLKGLNDEPVSGHNLYAVAENGGAFKAYRVKTDEKGNANFLYYPYDVRSYQTVKDAIITIRDESNSVFIEMCPSVKIKIKMVAPSTENSGNETTDSFFK